MIFTELSGTVPSAITVKVIFTVGLPLTDFAASELMLIFGSFGFTRVLLEPSFIETEVSPEEEDAVFMFTEEFPETKVLFVY